MTTVFGEYCREFLNFVQEKLSSACGLKAVLAELGGSEFERRLYHARIWVDDFMILLVLH